MSKSTTSPHLIQQSLIVECVNLQNSLLKSELAPQSINVGEIVIDQDSSVKHWNRFMANHSNIQSSAILDRNLFDQFKEFKDGWFQRKCEQVFSLHQGIYITWIERPFVFLFQNSQSVSRNTEFMYQNVSILPLKTHNQDKIQTLISIYDVTDSALKHKMLRELSAFRCNKTGFES